MNKRWMAGVLCVGFGFAMGCEGPEAEESEEGDAQPGAETEESLDEIVTESRVELTPEGVGRVETRNTTRREQLAELELEEAIERGEVIEGQQAVSTRASLCSVSDLRIWTGTNYTGHGLCFYGSGGDVDLDDYQFCGSICLDWGGWINSYKTGNQYGLLDTGSQFYCGGYTRLYASDNEPDYELGDNQDWLRFRSTNCTPP